VLRVNVFDLELPGSAELILGPQAIGVLVAIADDPAILVDAEFLAAFVPVAPGDDRAIRSNIGVDEEILDPEIIGAWESSSPAGAQASKHAAPIRTRTRASQWREMRFIRVILRGSRPRDLPRSRKVRCLSFAILGVNFQGFVRSLAGDP
jgi:hypothetical protein